MWDRGMLKDRAKGILGGIYFKALLISLVIAFFSGNDGINMIQHRVQYGERLADKTFFSVPVTLLLVYGGILFFLVRIFVGCVLEIGGRKFFIKAHSQIEDLRNLGFGFKKGQYMGIVKTMLYRDVCIFLWTLLLIIPGIIAAYSYRMVPYILADNPNIGYKRALQLSNEMTRGEKLDIWILDLSFIGWYLLGMLAFFVGMAFVMPYEDATNAELYWVLRDNALKEGLCTYEELNLVPEQ